MENRKKRINLSLDEKTIRILKELSKEDGSSMSQVVRRLAIEKAREKQIKIKMD